MHRKLKSVTAEADPYIDIEGVMLAHKLTILAFTRACLDEYTRCQFPCSTLSLVLLKEHRTKVKMCSKPKRLGQYRLKVISMPLVRDDAGIELRRELSHVVYQY